ncbi:hypothetical protein A4A49_07262 [Nicotiana attenuata]|uniref:Uncharacterized protein n=1 Tax=Nicotiana attenuata TaxID=49451 RepID=A0A1J6INN4_NICAT|nr:hypothetical protein A4A49_07262 [Nicotiana attenuata]
MKYKNSLSSFTIIIDRENSNLLYQGVRANVLCVVFGFIEVVLVDKRVVATYWPGVLKSNNKTNLYWEKWIVLKQLHSLQFVSILSCTMLRVITWLDNLLLITYLNTWAMNYEPREITVVDNLLRNDEFHYMLGALNILGNEFQYILWALKPPGLPEGIKSANQPAIVKGCGEMFPQLKNSRKGFNFFFINAEVVTCWPSALRATIVHDCSNEDIFKNALFGPSLLLQVAKRFTFEDLTVLNYCRSLDKGTLIKGGTTGTTDVYYMLGSLKTLRLHTKIKGANKRAMVEECGGIISLVEDHKGESLLVIRNATTAMLPVSAANIVDVGSSTGRFNIEGCEYKNIFGDDVMEKNIVSWCVLTNCHYQEGDLKTELFAMTVLGTYARMTKSLATILKIQKADAIVDRQPEKTSVDKLTQLRYSHWHWHFCGCLVLPAINK